jgi:hypothetical protein
MICSSTAQVSAARSTLRASLRVPGDRKSPQHFPIAQHRRFGFARAASFPCAQHWQMRPSLLSHCLVSLTDHDPVTVSAQCDVPGEAGRFRAR